MPKEQKLTKEILLNALGKTENTPEVQKIFQILGQADKFEDVGIEHQIYDGREYTYFNEGDFGYVWSMNGINMKLINEDTYYPPKYPLTTTPEVATFILYVKPDIQLKYKSCLPICNDPFFYEGMTIDDIEEKYGKPQRIWSSEKRQITRYTYDNLEGFYGASIQFSFDTNNHEVFTIVLGLEEK